MCCWVRRKFKGWKTIVANAVVGLPATALYLYTQFSTVDFTPVIPAKYIAVFLIGQSVLGVVLRIMTTGPIGSKEGLEPPQDVKAGD